MHFETSRSTLLAPLKTIAAVVERKQTLPILGNALVQIKDSALHLTATDSEIEIAYTLPLENGGEGATTIPALKFFDICRSLPDGASVQVSVEDHKAQIKSGRSRFSLACLPAEDFPSSEELRAGLEFSLPQHMLKKLFNQTQFAMAQQDVRYYLNGLLLDITPQGQINVVGTDGHRLALASVDFALEQSEGLQVIVPRKTVLELAKLLDDSEDAVAVSLGPTHIRFALPQFGMSSKLIDGRFPDYHGVVPRHTENTAVADCVTFRQALTRTVILSDEKYKGVRLSLSRDHLLVSVHNTEQEEAEEELDIQYSGEAFEIGFNAQYLLDALNAVETAEVALHFSDPNSSCLVQPLDNDKVKYVIMPMRL